MICSLFSAKLFDSWKCGLHVTCSKPKVSAKSLYSWLLNCGPLLPHSLELCILRCVLSLALLKCPTAKCIPDNETDSPWWQDTLLPLSEKRVCGWICGGVSPSTFFDTTINSLWSFYNPTSLPLKYWWNFSQNYSQCLFLNLCVVRLCWAHCPGCVSCWKPCIIMFLKQNCSQSIFRSISGHFHWEGWVIEF